LDDANSIKINKLSLEVISCNGRVFHKQLQNDSINLFDDIFELCNHKNQILKMAANEAIEKISLHISECLMEENNLHKDVFKYLIVKIKNVLETKTATILVNTAISLIGIFSSAIIRFMGESMLEKYLEELIILFDQDILNALGKEAFKSRKLEFETNSEKDKPSRSIKYVLYIQKQYISLLNAYANIIRNLTYISEFVVNHFYKVLLVGFSAQNKFFEKYKDRLCDSIASVIVNMFQHQNFFWSFLRKSLKNGLTESIKITENMLFKENVENLSIEIAVKFWINLFSQSAFTEYTLLKVFDQLMIEISDLVTVLNLNYREVKDTVNELNNIYYEAENLEDLEIYNRISNFLREFIKKLKPEQNKLFNPWVIIFLKKFCLLANQFPRISSTYLTMSSIMEYCQNIEFFNYRNDEIISFQSDFEIFNKNLIKRLEVFQDDLLLTSIEFLLAVPTVLIREIYKNNMQSLKYIFSKAFQIGYNDIRYSKLALNALTNFIKFENNSMKTESKELIREILPIFGEYLIEYEKIKESIDQTDVEMLKKYNEIQDIIFKILGEIGGEAHYIVKQEDSADNGGKILNIMNTKAVEYSLPLYNKKYNIYFDHILIKIADIAVNSVIKEKKYAAAELLHSMILYVIGLETKRTQDNTNILVFLMEKVLRLSCDLEKAICLIFEPLLFQIVHWMAKKGSISKNKDIISLLDIIIEHSTSRENIKLRDIASECICEYIKWFIKQHSDLTIKENSGTIKYIIRRIESNAQHPDPFKRLGASLCFEKLVNVLYLNDSLVDKFVIEMTYYCLTILKLVHNSNDLQDVIFEQIKNTIDLLIKVYEKKFNILNKPHPKRNLFKNIGELMDMLLDKFISVENEFRFMCQYLWIKLFAIKQKFEDEFKNPFDYFNKNKKWPILDQQNDLNKFIQTSSIYFQYFSFLTENKICDINELKNIYPLSNAENLFENLVKIIKIIFDSTENSSNFDAKQIFLAFISICNFILENNKMSEICFHLLNEKVENSRMNDILLKIIYNILIQKTFKAVDVKSFTLKKNENILNSFVFTYQRMLIFFLKNSKDFQIDLEKFYQNYLFFFFNLENKQNSENFLENSFSDLACDFYFSLLNELQTSQNFTTILKNNFKIIIELNHPKLKTLIKNYFNFLIFKDFAFIGAVITENQFNFDNLADYFFTAILNQHDALDKNILDNFIYQCCVEQDRAFLLFILLERASIVKAKHLIKIITKLFTSNLRNFENTDAVVNQIKSSNMIVYSFIEDNIIIPNDIDSLMNVVQMYRDRKSINITKELVNFLGLMVKLISNNLHTDNTSLRGYLYKKLDEKRRIYLDIQNKYFPIKTKYLKPNTKEFSDFQLIYNSFLNTFKTVKSFEFLELLFPILREEKTQYSKRVKNCIKEYISEILNNKSQLVVVGEIQKTIDVFLNKENDRNLKDNIRFTIMKILGFKIIKKCEIEILKEVFIKNYEAIEIMIKQNVNESTLSYESKFLIILEK
jgi:hypothetical protein